MRLYPYLFGQANFVQTKTQNLITTEDLKVNSYSFRPGLGLTGNFMENNEVSIRTSLQLGYTLPFENIQNSKNPLMLEFKLGLGLNVAKLKRNRQQNAETEQ
jgi:hypothetical protein